MWQSVYNIKEEAQKEIDKSEFESEFSSSKIEYRILEQTTTIETKVIND